MAQLDPTHIQINALGPVQAYIVQREREGDVNKIDLPVYFLKRLLRIIRKET